MINRRFLIKKKLGQGRSFVYLCEDAEHGGKNIALKILPANSTGEEKKIFKAEFETIQKLDHPNIIQAYERGTIVEISEDESVPIDSKYLAMEYFAGKELLDYPIDNESTLIEIVAQVCSVLFYLHQSRYIYYDLKPENILVGNVNGEPVIKLIDLGFASDRRNDADDVITGTAEYIAPEILKKEPHDHRIDLYSFGILLYRLIYKNFPFDSQDQLEIYKSHVEKDFTFVETEFSSELINIVKKLLNKNPDERYFSSIQILYDLGIQLSEKLYQHWLPIKIFSDRSDILNIINRHITAKSFGEIIVIRGFEKSGKSAVCQELYSRYENCIYFKNDRTKSGTQLVKSFLNKLLFNEFVFNKMPLDTLEIVDRVFLNSSSDLINEIKLIVNKVSQLSKFILLLDDFNLYDSFTLKIFEEIFPLLQVNGCSIILSEKSDLDYVTGFINNIIELNLPPFTTSQTEELLEKTYADFFPVNDVKQLVMQHADFLPGNIIEFLRDIVLLKIIQFEYDGIRVISGESSEKVLRNIYQEIYDIRYKSLNKEEIEFTQLLSALEIVPEKKQLIQLIDISEETFTKIVQELQRKNIFQSQSQSGLTFSSDGIKAYIYSHISNKKPYHDKLAREIRQKIPQFNKTEIARHFQLCEKYDESFVLLMSEAEEAEKVSAFTYKQDILEKLLKLPLNKTQNHEVKLKLCSLYHILNNHKNAFELVEEILSHNAGNNGSNELLIIRGNSLIRLGEAEKGVQELKSLLPSIEDQKKKTKVMLDIAWGELELNNYETAAVMGKEIINNRESLPEYKGDAYNLLGFISVNHKNDLEAALRNFQKCMLEYNKINSLQRIAAIEGNIGNIYNMKGEFEQVEKHWNKSLEISSSLGNLSYQALLLMNFGIYYFNRQSFEDSVANYQRAALTFNTIGEKIEYGKSETNLGEVYLYTCQYQNALDALDNARDIFHKLHNYLEESESLFLLAKIYLRIGDYKNYDRVFDELNNLIKANTFPERYAAHLKFLSCLHGFEINTNAEPNVLLEILDVYLTQEDRVNYFEAISLLINQYLKKGELKKAFDLVSDNNLQSVCDSNIYMRTEKLYYMGQLASQDPKLYLENPISYFNEAVDLMTELNVTETTCKILLQLSLYYTDRGNVLKAKEYAAYGRSLINFLADQFKDERSKDIYLNSSYRSDAWAKFSEIINSD